MKILQKILFLAKINRNLWFLIWIELNYTYKGCQFFYERNLFWNFIKSSLNKLYKIPKEFRQNGDKLIPKLVECLWNKVLRWTIELKIGNSMNFCWLKLRSYLGKFCAFEDFEIFWLKILENLSFQSFFLYTYFCKVKHSRGKHHFEVFC